MAETIKIQDGTTVVDFLGSNYKILTGGGWAPRRAQRRRGAMGGQSPYLDVVETMAIRVTGSTAADCLDKLGDLSDLLDQAEAWSKDSDTHADVYLEYEADGSALAGSLKATIIGPPDFGDEAWARLDVVWVLQGRGRGIGLNVIAAKLAGQ